jgi:hypothetical protein
MKDTPSYRRQDFGYAVLPSWQPNRRLPWAKTALYAVGVAGCVLAISGVLIAFG